MKQDTPVILLLVLLLLPPPRFMKTSRKALVRWKGMSCKISSGNGLKLTTEMIT